jgi:octaprenyl-diphosphate synthase
MLTNHSIQTLELVKEGLAQVKKLINEQLILSCDGEKDSDLDKLLESLHNRGGKMIRPGLCLLSHQAFCNSQPPEEVFHAAACIEMIHHATLLHDDVLDDGMQRRGKPTVNKIWGNEPAILLGDFLLSHVFKLSSELETRIIKILADSAIKLCEGELRQIVSKNNWRLSEPEYLNIIKNKSATLFSNSCYIGAILANAQERQAKQLADFGLYAGIAFQITDDLLDITGDEKNAGKTLGTDVDGHKPTLAVIHLLRTADKSKRSEIIKFCMDEDKCNNSREILKEMLKESGSLEYTSKTAQKYVSLAIHALDDLSHSEAKNALIETARFMIDRTS